MAKQEENPADRATLSPHQKRWNKAWTDFNRALRSPEPFNPFPWILTLTNAGLVYIYCHSGLNGIVNKYQVSKRWTSIIPLLVMGLVLFIMILYVWSIRKMIQARWCSSGSYCWAVPIQDITVFYLGSMVLFNYFKTNLTSPGVALSTPKQQETWSCMDNRGGFYGSRGYPNLNVASEEQRVSLYGKLDYSKDPNDSIQQKSNNTKDKKIFPSPQPSYCEKCDIVRPPRCHHCRICDRCVLQFDHHCLWVNNCIGYNNYRSFLALLLNVVLACWYGVAILMVPFYELVRQEQARQAAEYSGDDNSGWLVQQILSYQRSELFHDVPNNPWVFYQAVRGDGGLPWTIAIKIVYPLLLGIGTIMAVFLAFHMQYVVRARTTLEHKIVLETLCTSLWQESIAGTRLAGGEPSIQNPYDNGWRNNICRIIGPTPWCLLLPICVETPLPFLPSEDSGKKTK